MANKKQIFMKRGNQNSLHLFAGSNSSKYNSKRSGADKLCALCSGTGSNKCSRSDSEPYYSHKGALKCLNDGKGDVAFFKASILDKLSSAELANYKLLCLDGTQAGKCK